MSNRFIKAILITGLALCAGSHAIPPLKPVDGTALPDPDAKKKKRGEECRASGDCQRHLMCVKEGEKNVCARNPNYVVPPT